MRGQAPRWPGMRCRLPPWGAAASWGALQQWDPPRVAPRWAPCPICALWGGMRRAPGPLQAGQCPQLPPGDSKQQFWGVQEDLDSLDDAGQRDFILCGRTHVVLLGGPVSAQCSSCSTCGLAPLTSSPLPLVDRTDEDDGDEECGEAIPCRDAASPPPVRGQHRFGGGRGKTLPAPQILGTGREVSAQHQPAPRDRSPRDPSTSFPSAPCPGLGSSTPCTEIRQFPGGQRQRVDPGPGSQFGHIGMGPARLWGPQGPQPRCPGFPPV